MLKIGRQILYWSVLVLTGIALVGVNVTQYGCIHSESVYLEVKVVPVEKEGCCKECCPTSARHDFYKITDSSVIGRNVQLEEPLFFSLEDYSGNVLQLAVREVEKDVSGMELIVPEVPPSPEWLCTFLC